MIDHATDTVPSYTPVIFDCQRRCRRLPGPLFDSLSSDSVILVGDFEQKLVKKSRTPTAILPNGVQFPEENIFEGGWSSNELAAPSAILRLACEISESKVVDRSAVVGF